MSTTSRLRRPALGLLATACAAALTLSATAAVAAGTPSPNPRSSAKAAGVAPGVAAVSALFPPGSEVRFVAVAPCRIIDTRVSGGALVAGQRTFDATLASYAVQGGKAGTCNIPDVATSVQLNLGAISRNGSTSDLKGWATGTAEPLASLVNFNPSGPVANMVTMPVNGSGQFTVKTPGAAHIFADVAGYYVKPLYAAIEPGGGVYSSTASGVVSSAKSSTGVYTVTFNRDVERCAAAGTDIIFSASREITVDNGFSADPNTVTVYVRNTATGASEDTYFYVSLTC
ncbi:hypothetical protein G7075_01065 [Phycicoccus sp. HDW14]|uniref:hypothetical protein n=1 Tax=Phycicoccus sp. HDW14 TaxID=2714941 RepID=UPI00140E3629|nr:hypothetical protein [Phycicoccus sp. HDW14]QIM20058.1 hypothetical protein G7075_01065 [Phycicoccus sp. HDW14]